MPFRDGGNNRLDGAAGMPLLLFSEDTRFTDAAKAKLEGWGYRVHLESCEAAATLWLETQPVRIAIFDFDMPNHAAEELCLALRHSGRTGYVYQLGYGSGTETEHILLALESGADCYAHKPLFAAELRLLMEQANRLLALDDALFQGRGEDLASGMVGRLAFDRFYSILFAQYRRAGGSGVLLFVDLLNRPDIYSRHGFTSAYAVELEIARRIGGIHRASDFVARLDEGRFCLLLNNTTSLQAHTVAMRLGELLTDIVVTVEGRKLSPRLSVSMVDFPGEAQTPQEILSKATPTTVAVVGEG